MEAGWDRLNAFQMLYFYKICILYNIFAVLPNLPSRWGPRVLTQNSYWLYGEFRAAVKGHPPQKLFPSQLFSQCLKSQFPVAQLKCKCTYIARRNDTKGEKVLNPHLLPSSASGQPAERKSCVASK